MSRTITISLYSTVKSAPLMISSRSVSYPLVRNCIAWATRRGVWRSPSRSGSSPSSSSRRRIVSCMAALYLLVAGLAAQGPNPDQLYRQRETLVSARQAADIWAARAASGKDFEASWKLARACYWLGTHGEESERRAALDRGLKAAEQTIKIDPSKPEGHFWQAANMGAIAESSGMMAGLKYRGRIKDALERVIQID